MNIKKILLVFLALLAVCVIAVGIVAATFAADYNGTSRNGDTCKITIPEGSSAASIANILQEKCENYTYLF